MRCQIEVLFTPAEVRMLKDRDLSNAVCVVFDVLRATSSIVTALANGANAIIPVESLSESLALRNKQPDLLLAGERRGLRITSAVSGGIEFDLGNSPREYTRDKVAGRTIVTTTTNGTRTFKTCRHARQVLAASFLNLQATTRFISRNPPRELLLACAGTGEAAAVEDTLAAGAFCELLSQQVTDLQLSDSAMIARWAYLPVGRDLATAVERSENARRLLKIAELRDDVAYCLKRDLFPMVASMDPDGAIVKLMERSESPGA